MHPISQSLYLPPSEQSVEACKQSGFSRVRLRHLTNRHYIGTNILVPILKKHYDSYYDYERDLGRGVVLPFLKNRVCY
jgi:hypothetical protein